ncbi:IclR family transcriptional regulator [Cellulosimicrobium funkei]|nr:IclR family transcriptional regulator [Cellulosimicrobium funkei]
MSSDERNIPRSMIGRVAAVLGAFSGEFPVLGVNDIARRSGLAKSVTSRIISELVAVDFLERADNGVRVGIRLFELGELVQRSKELRRLALAAMADLRQATGTTVQLSVLKGTDQVYVEILRGHDAEMAIRSRVGGRVPAYATAGGKAVLAHSAEAVVDMAIPETFALLGPGTVPDEPSLRRQLNLVRNNGYAHEIEESNPGVECVACPILRGDGTPIAAISVSGPAGQAAMLQYAPAVRITALGLNRRIRANPAFNSL